MLACLGHAPLRPLALLQHQGKRHQHMHTHNTSQRNTPFKCNGCFCSTASAVQAASAELHRFALSCAITATHLLRLWANRPCVLQGSSAAPRLTTAVVQNYIGFPWAGDSCAKVRRYALTPGELGSRLLWVCLVCYYCLLLHLPASRPAYMPADKAHSSAAMVGHSCKQQYFKAPATYPLCVLSVLLLL